MHMNKLIEFAKKKGWYVVPYSEIYNSEKLYEMFGEYTDKYDGLCFNGGKQSKLKIVAYDDNMNEQEQESTLLHELGHALLGDWDGKNARQRMAKKIGDMELDEFIANMFSCVVTALKTYEECCNREV